MTKWKCPKCGYRTEQPKAVAAVSHVCDDGRDRELRREED